MIARPHLLRKAGIEERAVSRIPAFLHSSAIALVAALAAGCSTVTAPVYDTDPRVEQLRAAPAAPIDLAVTVGLPSLPAAAPADAARHAAPLDARALRDAVVGVLTAERAFRAVTPSDAAEPAAQLQEGWDRGDDLVLQLDVRRADVTYEGINGWFYPNLLVWFYAWVPAWWIADETYAGNLEVETRLVSVHSGKTVWRREFPVTVRQDLDDFDRGWGLFATVFPGSLDAEDWRGVAELLLPHVVHELKVGLFESARKELPGVAATPAFGRDMAKTLYLGIGVTAQKSYAVQNVAWAEHDARALGDALRAGLGLPERNVRLLADAQATKDNILKAIDEFLVARARPDDTLVCHVGARGVTLADGRPAIVPYFFEPRTAAADALPLADLLAALDRAAGRHVLVLDVGWAGDVAGRGVRHVAEVEHGEAGAEALDRCGSERRLVLCAAGPRDGAYELDERQHSLVTHYLLEGLRGAADADNDRVVTAAEALAFAAGEAARQAGLEGRAQTPRVLGAAPGAVLARLASGAVDAR